MQQEWITDRLPTAADGDEDGEVRLANSDRSDYRIVAFEYVHPGAPWQHTSSWVPPVEPTPAEPDRITALEQQVAEHIRAQSVLTAALVKRIEALEGVPADGAIPDGGRGVPGGITALEQRITELETLFWAHSHPAAVEPTTEPRQ